MHKQYASVISSRRNICYTLCLKSSLQFAHDIITSSFFKSSIEGDFTATKLSCRSYYANLLYPIPFDSELEILVSYNCRFKGTIYKIGLFLTMTRDHVTELYEIIELLTYEKKLFIVGQIWQCGPYNEHLLAHEALNCSGLKQIRNSNDFDGPPLMIHSINNRYYFRKRYDFYEDDNDL